MLPWMMECSAVLLNRCVVSSDGFVAHRRLEGRGGAVRGICFGEKVMFRHKLLPKRVSKLASHWEHGVHLVMRMVSWEMMARARQLVLEGEIRRPASESGGGKRR